MIDPISRVFRPLDCHAMPIVWPIQSRYCVSGNSESSRRDELGGPERSSYVVMFWCGILN